MIPESPHMLMWVMSDRAIPRSYRMMEGFGVHTFRLVNAAGETSLVKFHWKPVLGVHGLVWDEALTLNGVDPDFHRRDLYNAIGAGAFPEWELGVQVMPDTEDQYFEGIDLLDATKLVPEELVPVQPIGRMTLNRNPANFFAEVEQVAFHAGHLVRGIEVTDDPLMHARLFSYLDTQLTRLGGPNFSQIPINRPHAPVNDNLRDGFHQQAVHHGTHAVPAERGRRRVPVPRRRGGRRLHPRAPPVEGPKVRDRGPDDEYAQATLFWNSMTEVEQDHIVDAYTFELGKVDVPAVVERMVTRLALVDAELARRVCVGLGLPAPPPPSAAPARPRPRPPRRRRRGRSGGRPDADRRARGVAGAGDGDARTPTRSTGAWCRSWPTTAATSPASAHCTTALIAAGAVPHVVATHKGAIRGAGRRADELTVDRSFHTASSAECRRGGGRPRRRPRGRPGRARPTCRAPTATSSRSPRGATAPSCCRTPALDRRAHVAEKVNRGVRRRGSSTPSRSTATGSEPPPIRPAAPRARGADHAERDRPHPRRPPSASRSSSRSSTQTADGSVIGQIIDALERARPRRARRALPARSGTCSAMRR